ncbi:hypothetical protein GCM10010269_42520 [Streptomyces humidus]|uniref:Lipoprotein n=1 Tax=Streptomyces humidus TaxID=52259 RepID=A0A918FXW1_9ACTN|nr:hypothetical protein [Streptomyces humidus]GGR99177.1 hypothetical protein GCM10010269_42520 [Streptomyces humidus]
MKRSTGTRLCATAAIGALSLSLLTACSDDGAKDAGEAEGSASSTASSAAKALPKAELEKLLLAQGEIKGYKVTSGDDTLPASKSAVKTDEEACAPLAYAISGLAPGDTDSQASNTLTEDNASAAATKAPEDISQSDLENAFKVSLTFVGLSSYEGDGAEKAFKSVSDGVAACSGGFGVAAQGEKQKITKVASEKAPGSGDESVAFSVDSDVDGGESATFHTQVVRKGNTVASFYTVDFASLTSTGKSSAVPAAVVAAQVAKIR